MKYRVIWAPHAEKRLEQFLRVADEQATVAAAAKEIDQHLVADPFAFGESRYDTVRVGFVRPLGVQFEFMDDMRMAIVYDVWRIDRK
jgi:hypothetical protein